MRAPILLLVLVLALAGCAVGRVTPDGGIAGFAIGHAKLERRPDATLVIEGGALSNNLSELFASLIAAAGAAYATYLGGV